MQLRINEVTIAERENDFSRIVIDIGTYEITKTCCQVLYVFVPDENCTAILDYNTKVMKIKKEKY